MASASRQKSSVTTAFVTAALFGVAYAGGYFTLTQPAKLSMPGMGPEEMQEEIAPPAPRRYVTFPVSVTVGAPNWGTLLIDIGMAVQEDMPRKATENLLEESHLFTGPLSEALLLAVEDTPAKDMQTLQAKLPPLLVDALNSVFATEDMPTPVLEVLILKLIATG